MCCCVVGVVVCYHVSAPREKGSSRLSIRLPLSHSHAFACLALRRRAAQTCRCRTQKRSEKGRAPALADVAADHVAEVAEARARAARGDGEHQRVVRRLDELFAGGVDL